MHPDPTIAALLAQLDTEYTYLRELLAGRDDALLAERPPNGKWSVLENVQHLVFTGHGHLGNYAPEKRDWGSLGFELVEPRSEKQLRLRSGGSIDDLLAAWRTGHERYVPVLRKQDTAEVRHHVGRHIRHQQQHIREIARLLKPRRGS